MADHGYLGTWAGLTAWHARERRQGGIGEWAGASLSTAGTLTPSPFGVVGETEGVHIREQT